MRFHGDSAERTQGTVSVVVSSTPTPKTADLTCIFGVAPGRSRRICALAFAIGLLLLPAAAQATTITVDSTADSLTGCTLRNAIKAANLNTTEGTCAAGQP